MIDTLLIRIKALWLSILARIYGRLVQVDALNTLGNLGTDGQRNGLLLVIGLSILFSIATPGTSHAQCETITLNGTNYTVTVNLSLTEIIVNGDNCPYGYNYDVGVEYSVVFGGSSPPPNLDNLQGNIHCGGQNLFFSIPTNGSGSYVVSNGDQYQGDCDVPPTLEALSCNRLTLNSSGPGMSYSSTSTTCEHENTLPVIWNEFQISYSGNAKAVDLSWSTFKETFNDVYIIERSYNGISDWEQAGEIEGAGWSDELKYYTFQDIKLPAQGGGRMYYRIKQVDLNNAFTYSKIVAVDIPKLFSAKTWTVYPYPAKGQAVNLAYQGQTFSNSHEKITLKAFNATQQFGNITVSNPQEADIALKTLLQNFQSGLVIVEISWGDQLERHKLML